MAIFTQETRLLELTTPLGKDKLLIRSIDGMEGISQLFSYRVECFASNDEVVDFSKIIGQHICVRVILDAVDVNAPRRYFHGVAQTITRGARGYSNTSYSIQVVPSFWLLSRTTQSRIFQQKSVPDILKLVLVNVSVPFSVSWEIQGTYQPRDYCSQYRESDFDFACRLMEEEGIFYFFKHEESKHVMVVADSPTAHKDLPHSSTLYYDPDVAGVEDVVIVYSWEKSQTLRSGKTTLWDHSFELPHKNLEAQDLIVDTVQVGTVTHKLKVGGNEGMELYDYPGGYAERFDGITSSGGEQAGELQKIFDDNKRTTKIRMQQEAVNSLNITGYTAYLGITPGFKFALDRHFEDNDSYLLTRSHFSIPQMGGYAGDDDNDTPPPEVVFNCIPVALPFRPQRVSAKPMVYGTQTAVVVGPPGEEIYTDKYGRVKIQLFWDRSLPYDASSSCWCRCAVPWAGKNFGFMSIPRIGHEVVVAFEEGDPDQPIIVGSVYNADMMASYGLPDNKTMSMFKSRSSPGGGGFNELRFEDKKDGEQVFIHAQKNMDVRILNDKMEWIGRDSSLIVKRDLLETIERDVHRKVHQDSVEEIGRDRIQVIKGKAALEITGSSSTAVTSNVATEIGGDSSLEVKGKTFIKSKGPLVIESTDQISLKVGGNFIDISKSGITIQGTMVNINSGGSAGSGSKVSINPKKAPSAPVVAATSDPGGHKEYSGGGGSTARTAGSANSPPQSGSTHNPGDPETQKKTHWVGIVLKDRTGRPMAGQNYSIVLPNGEVSTGTLDDQGKAKVEHIDAGQCQVSFPGLADWEKA